MQSGSPPGNGQGLRSVLLWLGVLILVTVAGGLMLMWYRRRVLGKVGVEDESTFMDELRKARDSGEMSQVEFDAARRQMIARMRGKPDTVPGAAVVRAKGASRFGFHEGASDSPTINSRDNSDDSSSSDGSSDSGD